MTHHSWEYHIEFFAADSPAEEDMLRDPQRLNALGAEGWELANVVWRPKTEEGWRRDWGQALVFCMSGLIHRWRVMCETSVASPLFARRSVNTLTSW
jgi:hypothetical protein